MNYIEGFVLPVPKKNLKAYGALSRKAGKIFRKHGAIGYFEAVGDDLEVPFGLPFPKRVKVKAGETVVFAWIVYKSRAHRDRANKRVMADPAMKPMMTKKMPFDMQRMSCGGFKVFVDV